MKIINRASVISLVILAILLTSLVSCGGGRAGKRSTAEDQFRLAKKHYDKKKYFESAAEFQKVVYNFPGSQLVDTAQYYLAMSYMVDGQYELAAVEFERLLKNYPRSPYAVESRYRIGYSFFRASPGHYGLDQTEVSRSIKLLEDFILDYPESKFVDDAQESIMYARTRLAEKDYKTGIVYMHMGVYTAAEKYFQLVIDEYGDTKFAAESLYEMAKARYKLKQWDKAAQSANSFVALYPEHKAAEKARKLIIKIEKDRAKSEAPDQDHLGTHSDAESVNSFAPRTEK